VIFFKDIMVLKMNLILWKANLIPKFGGKSALWLHLWNQHWELAPSWLGGVWSCIFDLFHGNMVSCQISLQLW